MWLCLLVLLGNELIVRAKGGDLAAQWEAARLSRKGQLGELAPKQAAAWYKQALQRRVPGACLEEALELLEKKRDAEDWLRCAAAGGVPEGQHLLGRLILNRIGAEDEPERFEGLAWVALAAKAGFGPAQRQWELLVAELPFEDLERVEQTTKKLR
jgi:TPR repeat protein